MSGRSTRNTPLRSMHLLKAILLVATFGFLGAGSIFAVPHTPQPGSEERKPICDRLREYVAMKVALKPLPQPIVFKIDHLRVEDGYAWFEGFPQFKNGADSTQYLPDQGYIFLLHQSANGWEIKQDLSRSDVPDEKEAAQLRQALVGVPSSIMPDFWGKLLKR